MSKKIVNEDFSVPGMEPLSMFRQILNYKRMPYIGITEGPRIKYLYDLFCLHDVGRLMVYLEVNFPRSYGLLMRIRNSLVFRYNHYRRKLSNKFGGK